MWVVKLGGSLLDAPELRAWLHMLVRCGDGRVVIVPGGSVFADAVREAQARSGIDDAVAHRLAVLAMDQYGHLLTGICPELVVADSELELAERGWQHRAIVWLPSRMVLTDESIPASWSVTSDSLAAWLALKIGAERLVLVKSGEQAAAEVTLPQLGNAGVVDDAFRDFAARLACPVHVVGKGSHAAFAEALTGGEMPGTVVRI